LGANTEVDLENQANTYKALLDIIIAKSKNGKVGWNTWQIDDRHAWRGEEYPSLFDEDYKHKPAYYAVQMNLPAASSGVSCWQIFISSPQAAGN